MSNVIQFADFRAGRNASAKLAAASPSKPRRTKDGLAKLAKSNTEAVSPIGEKPQVDHKARRKAWECAERTYEFYDKLYSLSSTAYAAWEYFQVRDAKLLHQVLSPLGSSGEELHAKLRASLKALFLTPAPSYTVLRQKERWATGIRWQRSGLARDQVAAAIAADYAWLNEHAERPRKPTRGAP
jgi:hypothetical protein